MTENTTLYPLSSLVSHKSLMTVNINRTYAHLPDIVNDCEQQQVAQSSSNDQTKLICKQIAQSLRVVADQMDQKYCQVSSLNSLLTSNLFLLSVLGWRFQS